MPENPAPMIMMSVSTDMMVVASQLVSTVLTYSKHWSVTLEIVDFSLA